MASPPTNNQDKKDAPGAAAPVEHDDSPTGHPSGDEGDDQDTAPAIESAASTGTGATTGKKSKKKRKSGKALSHAASDLKQTIASMPPSQVAELLKLNPAISQEIGSVLEDSISGTAGAAGATGDKAAVSAGTGTATSAGLATPTEPAPSADRKISSEAALAALQQLNLADLVTGMATSSKNVKDMASYKFWKTQPVPKFGEDDVDGTSRAGGLGKGRGKPFVEGPIQELTLADVPKEPPPLVEGFEWDTLDLTDDVQLQEVFDLLSGHFVEDSEAMFRFRYSRPILKWAMMSPGWIRDWHIGVRATQSRKLVAFISAIPLELRVRDRLLHASEVNFLVVHKKLRSKRLTPILIKEITRLCNLRGVWQALYTAGVVLPKPVSTARYYHRSLNWQKLYEVGFSPLPPNSKPQYQVRKYALPDHTRTRGLRPMKAGDVDAVHHLLTRYLKRFDMVMEFTREEIDHWLLDKKLPGDEQVVYTYVVEDAQKITDMFSFYCLDSSVLNNPRHNAIHAAYLFYYATEVGLTEPTVDKAALKTRLNELMNDALILAKKLGFDVFNALSHMDSALFLEQQKFGPGDGQLHYYLFNYRAMPISGGVNQRNALDEENLSGVGFVMM